MTLIGIVVLAVFVTLALLTLVAVRVYRKLWPATKPKVRRRDLVPAHIQALLIERAASKRERKRQWRLWLAVCEARGQFHRRIRHRLFANGMTMRRVAA